MLPPPEWAAAVAVMLTVWDADPPAPVHAKVNVSFVLTVSESVPLVASVPLQPVPPLAVQEVAFVLDQVSVTDPPLVTVDALDEKDTVGNAGATLIEYNP